MLQVDSIDADLPASFSLPLTSLHAAGDIIIRLPWCMPSSADASSSGSMFGSIIHLGASSTQPARQALQ
jgi:hypothetical protein